MPDFKKELKLFGEGFDFVIGVDEAGRGPWAGPVVAAAVVVKKDSVLLEGVTDSKLLTEKKRLSLYEEIKKYSISFGISEVSNAEIDECGLIESTRKAMGESIRKAVAPPALQVGHEKLFAIVDGRFKDGLDVDFGCDFVDKGDQKHYSVAAASILAKVFRDEVMVEIDKNFPEYGFKAHKGYGTKTHKEAIDQYGVCEFHRKSFKPVANALEVSGTYKGK